MEKSLFLNKPKKLLIWLLTLFFAATPCDYILPHIGSATVLWLLGLLISAVCAADLFLLGHKKVIITTENIILVLLTFLSLVSMLWADDYAGARSYFFSFVAIAAMYFMLFLYDFEKEDIKRFELASIAGGLLMIFYVFTQVNLDLVRAGYRLDFNNIGSEDFSDPNGLSARLMMPLVFCFKYIFEGKKLVFKLPLIAELAGIVYIMFLTGSRAAVITLALSVFIILMSNINGKRSGTALIMIFAVFIALIIFPNMLPEHIYNRIFNFENYEAVTYTEGDRIDIWKNAITTVFPKAPIFGFGIGNSSYAMSEVYGKIKALHSSWFVPLIDLGIVGFALWMSFVISKINLSVKLRTKTIYPLVVMIATVIMATTLDSQKEKYLWNAFLYANMVYTMYCKQSDSYKRGVNNL